MDPQQYKNCLYDPVEAHLHDRPLKLCGHRDFAPLHAKSPRRESRPNPLDLLQQQFDGSVWEQPSRLESHPIPLGPVQR